MTRLPFRRHGAILLALFAAPAMPPAQSPPAPFVQAAEFPYYLCPPSLWERELVHLKNIGISTVEFSIPQNVHQLTPGDFDFTGRTSPRRDLAGFIHLLRRLGLQAWIETNSARGDWARALASILAPQIARHGGPVAWVFPALAGIDAPAPPVPVRRISATDGDALALSRDVLATGRGSLVWTAVFDALYPAGSTPAGSPPLREGAIGFNGEERWAAPLRRAALLLRGWAPLLPQMQPGPSPKPVNRKLPADVATALLFSRSASAISIVNRSRIPLQDDIRAVDPVSKRSIVIPGVFVAPGESLWLPAGVSLSQNSLCRECSNFSPVEEILYATAELVSIEYENGILAMEFAAPRAASVVLQLEREPVGPFLASGKPTEFEWDDKTLRARLPIPAGTTPDHHVRIGIAIEEPETSAFFDDAHRLIIGAVNAVSTTYSSPSVAARSRLRLPEGYTAEKKVTTPNQIEYRIAVPASAAEGDYANLVLEADGMALGRARLELFRPVTVRFSNAIAVHFGPRATLTANPTVIPVDPKAGTEIEFTLRNNWPAIETYKLEAVGEGLDFFPAKTEITIGAVAERGVNMRVFAAEGATNVRPWRLRIAGGASFEAPARAVIVPRTGTAAWTADLDEDGSPEWILESAQARAVFSARDGGRWMEFTWKDGGINFLPIEGVFAGEGAVDVRETGDAIDFSGKGWTRTVRLQGASLTIAQNQALPVDRLAPVKLGNVSLHISRDGSGRATYTLSR